MAVLVGIDGHLEVEVEHELEISVGERAALELEDVYSEVVQAGEHLAECARLMRQGEHDARFVGAGVYLKLF